MDKKLIQKTWIQQHDQSDCGVACLASVIRFHGGESKLEKLRELSGTSKQGTTLLGLYQAANQLGFEAGGYEADMENLKKIETPVILHVVMDERLNHYVVCHGYENEVFTIADPAKGISTYTAEALLAIWKTKTLLQLKPNAQFVKKEAIKFRKKNWVINLVKEDYNLLAVALFLGIIITILGMATAVFSQKLIDEMLPARDISKLTLGLSLLGVLLISRSGLSYLRGLFLIRQSKDFNNRIINKFYGALLHLPKSFFDTRKTGALIARMNDTSRIQGAISYLAGNIIIDILILIISSSFIFTYSWEIGVLALVSIPLYALLVWRYNQQIIDSQKEVMGAYAKNESNYVDTMQGIAVIKGSNKEALFEAVTKTVYGFFQDKIFALGKLNIIYGLLSELIGVILILAVIGLSSFMVLADELLLGEMVAILSMAGGIIPAVNRLAISNIRLQEAKVAFDRMFEFADIDPEYLTTSHKNDAALPTPKPLEQFNMLKVEKLSFRFAGRSQLLKSISFEVKTGEMIALLGESGCGKSTTLSILQKFYAFESGGIKVNDVKWEEIDTKAWRNVIATVPQEVKLFNASLLENICLGDVQKEAETVVAFCKEFGFDTFFEALPQNYLTILGEEGVNLSGGQKQLVALARALYRKPQLLLLDEATAAMDSNTERFIMNILQKSKNEMGVILVTHRIKTASKADRIYIMEDGVIQGEGSPQALLLTDNFYSAAYRELVG